MDDVVSRLAREIADAIGGAVAQNPRVEACREKARAAGYELRVSLEAEIGFGSRSPSESFAKVAAPAVTGAGREQTPAPMDITANDRRFLRALRIAADHTKQAAE